MGFLRALAGEDITSALCADGESHIWMPQRSRAQPSTVPSNTACPYFPNAICTPAALLPSVYPQLVCVYICLHLCLPESTLDKSALLPTLQWWLHLS